MPNKNDIQIGSTLMRKFLSQCVLLLDEPEDLEIFCTICRKPSRLNLTEFKKKKQHNYNHRCDSCREKLHGF